MVGEANSGEVKRGGAIKKGRNLTMVGVANSVGIKQGGAIKTG
jgi:hypothetical protein